MKLTDMIVSTIFNKGKSMDLRNITIYTEIPETGIKATIKIDHMQISFEGDKKDA